MKMEVILMMMMVMKRRRKKIANIYRVLAMCQALFECCTCINSLTPHEKLTK